MAPKDEPAAHAPVRSSVGGRKLILFVHGLAGAAGKSWGKFESLIKADSLLQDYDVDFYSYPTGLIRLPFGRRSARIQELAKGLRTYIDNKCDQYSEIVLVTHSMGGLIAKRYLLDEVMSGRHLRARGLILYAVPHGGSALANVGGLLSWGHHQLAQLRRYSDVCDAICDEWGRMSMDSRLRTRCVIGTLDQIVDPKSASASPGTLDPEILVDKGHRSIVKPQHAGDLSYLVMRNFLLAGNTVVEASKPAGEARAGRAGNGTHADVLFDVYSPAVEPWYARRQPDDVVAAFARRMGVWISGPTGTGKTAILKRYLDLNARNYTYVILAGHGGGTILDMFNEIAIRLEDRSGAPRVEGEQNLPGIIRKITSLLKSAAKDEPFYLFVEEIPLAGEKAFQEFIEAIYSLSVELGASSLAHPVILLLSSINDPNSHINGRFDKIREKMQFVKLGPWSETDISKLIGIIGSELKLEFPATDLSQIITAAAGSPRFIKVFFRRRTGDFYPGLELSEILAMVRTEVI